MPETKPSSFKPNYAFCQFLNPEEAHKGKPCDCFTRNYFNWASVSSHPAVTLDSTSFTFKTASSSRQEVHLTDNELRVTKPNSCIEIYETYQKDNPINRPIQVFYMDEQRSKKKSIPVALVVRTASPNEVTRNFLHHIVTLTYVTVTLTWLIVTGTLRSVYILTI